MPYIDQSRRKVRIIGPHGLMFFIEDVVEGIIELTIEYEVNQMIKARKKIYVKLEETAELIELDDTQVIKE